MERKTESLTNLYSYVSKTLLATDKSVVYLHIDKLGIAYQLIENTAQSRPKPPLQAKRGVHPAEMPHLGGEIRLGWQVQSQVARRLGHSYLT